LINIVGFYNELATSSGKTDDLHSSQTKKTTSMARSRKKIAKGGVEAGYSTSDETFDKPRRQEERKRYRKNVRGLTTQWLSNPDTIDLDTMLDKKPHIHRCSCMICFERCNKPLNELRLIKDCKKEIEEKEELAIRYEKKNYNLSISRTYRRVKFK
jgi:hypothetical protein